MKIKKLKLKNFGAFTDFECEFDGKLTHLVGVNGSGKTTVGLTSIWAGLKGIAERKAGGQLTGERFRFIGNAKASADIELTLHDDVADVDVIIKNHITKATNSITFDAPEGYPIDQEWLNGLLSVAFLSAKNFTALDGKQQALLLGIDTSEHDAKIAKLKEDATVLGRQLTAFGDMSAKPAKVEAVSVKELMAEREAIATFNAEQEKLLKESERLVELIGTREITIEQIEAQLKMEKQNLIRNNFQLKELPDSKEHKSTEALFEKINSAEQPNKNASAYDNYQTAFKAMDAVQGSLADNRKHQKIATIARLTYIKKHDFGFDGLEVDENGRLLLNDRPLKEPYFSKGELELIVSKLYMSLDPELKIRFIDDFELLDEDNQVKIVDALLAEGFQVITAQVGKVATKENTILLRECKKVDTSKGEPKKSLT